MSNEVRRDVVKLGIDFRPIPVDLGDGIEWEFTSDPSTEQWSTLLDTITELGKLDDKKFSSDSKTMLNALTKFTKAMSAMLLSEEQQEEWLQRGYGLGPQQAISEALTEIWTGFPTKQQSNSGEESKKTG